ncbi:nitronate monooxygenase family protein [Acidiferrimicrobium sp. IK]|uniref:nitronate monooxygenase n=1 Tax=Acidiferrimicrobium sp. IK TaxID=2871700 RepID=UPI0021CB4084|nr:nitronate monooxygenase family protein [Acidiferrimicrobium sp. IK]MCU4187467.1 nitronate monooxygenase family protein [Acidiferrimicrobium sp. IK]
MSDDVTGILGMEYPVLAFSHCRDVVAAVSRTGGFGVLGAVAHSPERLEVDLAWIEEHCGGRPYGVDLLLPEKYVGAGEGGLDREALSSMLPPEHRHFVDEILERYKVPPAIDEAEANAGLSLNISPAGYEPLLEVAFGHRIGLLASALGPPPAEVIEQAHARGVKVAALAGSVHHARRHAEAGADLIIAQGTEAGGHTGEIATMVLVPEVVDAVAPVPVLAAGGIARGRQVAAAMALGAKGVWTGSVWLTTEEAETQPAVKEKFLRATSSDTIRSRSITGKPARMLRSAWTDAWEAPDSPGTLGMPLQPLLVGPALARINRAAHQPGTGANQLVNYFVGQVVGSLTAVRPARQVLLDMMEEYADVIRGLCGGQP